MTVRKIAKRSIKKRSAITLRDKSKKSVVKKRDVSTPKSKVPSGGTVGIIRKCMTDKHILSFSYRSVKGEVSHRSVEPYKIELDKGGAAVLWGWCLEKDAIRKFKIAGLVDPQQETYVYAPRFAVEDLL